MIFSAANIFEIEIELSHLLLEVIYCYLKKIDRINQNVVINATNMCFLSSYNKLS